MGETIEAGDKVTFNYQGSLEDGTTFHTFDEEPLAVEVGSGSLVKGLEDALMGMEVGQEKEFKVPPEQGYGEDKLELVQTIDSKLFDEAEITPEEGMVLKTPHGNCHVTKIMDDKIEISYNHPLAGKTLDFKVKVINIAKK